MKKSVGFKFAASTLVLGLTMVGCKPSGYRPAVNSAKAATTDAGAAKAYDKARQAVQQGDNATALEFAERAVELAPRDAGYRMLLADLYLKNGRFVSADQAFADVLSLDPVNQRAGLSRALALIGQGKTGEATIELDRFSGSATPTDVGLAYALAGQPQRAIEMLEPAARAPGATGRVRQNLALAYAMAGDWQKARRVAEQDLSPSEVAGRLEQWASFANPSAPHAKVAALLGVTPVADAGQPVRLALASTQPVAYASVQEAAPEAVSAPVISAQAAPAPVVVAQAAPAPVIVAQAAPEPVTLAQVVAVPVPAPQPVRVAALEAAPVPALAPAPVTLAEPAPIPAPQPTMVAVAEAAPLPAPQAVPEPVRETFAYRAPQTVETFAAAPSAPATYVESIKVPSVSAKRSKRMTVEAVEAALDSLVKAPAPAKRATVRLASAPIPTFKRAKSVPNVQPAFGGRYVVQLGAFRTAAQVERAWAEAQRRYRFSGGEPLTTTVNIAGKGTFHRLAVAGFGNPIDANRMCQSIRSRNGVCFVRETAGDARVQWASRYTGRRA
jgi:Flp pilus assembly protein TadD